MVEFKVAHSRDGVRRVYERIWSRRFGLAYRILLGLLVALFVVALGIRGMPGYLLAAICVVVVIASLMRVTRDSTIKLALEYFDLAQASSVTFRIDDVGVTERSAIGQIHLQWSAFAGYLELPGFFLLIRAPAEASQFVAFPAEQFPDAARRLVTGRLDVSSIS